MAEKILAETPATTQVWQPIESAPKDGTVVLVYCPKPEPVDEHVWPWPENSALAIMPARWCSSATTRSDCEPGWYAPWARVSFGVYDDPSTDFDQAHVMPTHWLALPQPPQR